MTFATPQAQDAPTYPAQAVEDATDLAALLGALSGTGWISGCAVTPHSPGVWLLTFYRDIAALTTPDVFVARLLDTA